MGKAEDRIIEYEERLPKETNPAKIKLMQEAIEKLIDAAKSDIAKAINALTKRLIEMPDAAFELNAAGGRKLGPLSGFYPYLNDVENVCKEVSALEKLPKYRNMAKVLKTFALGMETIRRHLIKGGLETKDQTVSQYELMLKDFLRTLEGSGFSLRDRIRQR
ncbi:TPA: hypothetical protein HA219_01470 [Candidatus Woesearchaeota archaeon]|nr:hypothetical protein [Candidatus Woesearchaeota archaeon]HIH39376.1 hypothetical protein [Candidatus Woesearchaeota archaeon]